MVNTENITRRNPEMERYVRIVPAPTNEYPEAHDVLLNVGNQTFNIGKYGHDTLAEAEWYRDMLCIALARLAADVRQECVDLLHTQVNASSRRMDRGVVFAEAAEMIQKLAPDEGGAKGGPVPPGGAA